MNGVTLNTNFANTSSTTYIGWLFKRARGVFDQVCYTGNGTVNQITHNLGVVPDMIIIKNRSSSVVWDVWTSSDWEKLRFLNSDSAGQLSGSRFSQNPSATTIFLSNTSLDHNNLGDKYVCYLFATLPGISKVGTYTGNGSGFGQTINAGFTTGARFVIIKRTDSAGDWYVWDTTRGIVAASDPHLLLNTTAAEVTTEDSIDPVATGFSVVQVATTNINVSAATYLFLAIA